MGSSDGNQDPNETPDLTNNEEAVDINADAQKVKKFANIILYPMQLLVQTNSKEKINKWRLCLFRLPIHQQISDLGII